MKRLEKTIMLLLVATLSSMMVVGCGKNEDVTEESTESTTETIVEETTPNEWDTMEISTLYNTYYRQLAQIEKDAYRQILYCVDNGESLITLNYGLDNKGIDNVMKALEYDNPQLFWITGGYTFTPGLNELEVEFNALAEKLDENKATFNSKVDELMGSLYFPYKAKDYIKEKLVHDKVIEIVKYDEENELGYSAFSALVDGKASCGGYAKAFQLLMQKSNVPCYYSVGRVYQGDNITDHAWNVVRLGEGHYNVDLTLNDTALEKFGVTSYEFYNLSDAELAETRVKNFASTGLPPVQGEEFGYEELYGESAGLASLEALGLSKDDVVDDLDEFNKYMVNKLIELGLGEHTFKIVIEGEGTNNEVHYALSLKSQLNDYLVKINEINKKDWNQISIENEVYDLGDGFYLIEISYKLEYIKVEVEKPEEEKQSNSGGAW